jgi:hypothetical protein
VLHQTRYARSVELVLTRWLDNQHVPIAQLAPPLQRLEPPCQVLVWHAILVSIHRLAPPSAHLAMRAPSRQLWWQPLSACVCHVSQVLGLPLGQGLVQTALEALGHP